MFINNLQHLFTRDLTKLKEEIALYKNESTLWKTEKHIANSAGDLCLHLAGNLNAFIGAVIGETGYIRNRPEEFAAQHVPRELLLNQIEKVIETVHKSLDKLTPDKLETDYPLQVFGKPITYALFLLHLSGHLMYHLGQINYHRRLLDDADD